MSQKAFTDEVVAKHEALKGFLNMLSKTFVLVMSRDGKFDVNHDELVSMSTMVQSPQVGPLCGLPAFTDFRHKCRFHIMAMLERTLDTDGKLDHPVRTMLLGAFKKERTFQSLVERRRLLFERWQRVYQQGQVAKGYGRWASPHGEIAAVVPMQDDVRHH